MIATDSTLEGFLNAIRGDETTDVETRRRLLADDAPRLVMADWLEEQQGTVRCETCKGTGWMYIGGWASMGHPAPQGVCIKCKEAGEVSNGLAERAELIRVQCELARLGFDGGMCPKCGNYGGPCNTCERQDVEGLQRRQWELTLAIPNHKHPMNVPNDGTWKWQWTRGFVSSITTTEQQWLRHGRDIVRAPVCAVERVEAGDAAPYFDRDQKFRWFPESGRTGEHPQSDVPDEIYTLIDLPESKPTARGSRIRKTADSESAAREALSEAMIEWAWKSA